jgi:antitoxin HicB
MTDTARRPLADYLAMEYPFDVIADPDGGYVIRFPDLPGCLTQVDHLDEVGPMAAEIRELWIESAYDHGHDIPLPTYPEECSGKFNLRLPRSLHRRLAEAAERDGVSLNQYAVMLLSQGVALDRLDRLIDRIDALQERAEPEGATPDGHPAGRQVEATAARRSAS